MKNECLRELEDQIENLKHDRNSSINKFKKLQIIKKKEQIVITRIRIDEIKAELFDLTPRLKSYNLKLNKIELNIEHHQRLLQYFREKMIQKFHIYHSK